MENVFQKKEIIYCIAKERSFSKAAQKLFIAQPSLSMLVRKLEEELGVPLFDRSSKPIRLTEAGEAYIRATEQIRQTEQDFAAYIAALNNMETGTLYIGSNQLLSSLVLPRYISAFMQKYPNIHLSLMDANSTQLENAITDGALDIVIDNSLLPNEQFLQRYLATEYLLLAVPAHFPENEACREYGLTYTDILENRHIEKNRPVPLERFSQTPFILMNRDNDIRKQTASIFQQTNFTPKVLMEMDRLLTLYTYVQQGTAASLVSDTLVRHVHGEEQSNIVFYTLPTEFNKRNIYASYKRNKFCSKAVLTLLESLSNLR
jgi:DNA-binding transcriptional LysR family regulator